MSQISLHSVAYYHTHPYKNLTLWFFYKYFTILNPQWGRSFCPRNSPFVLRIAFILINDYCTEKKYSLHAVKFEKNKTVKTIDFSIVFTVFTNTFYAMSAGQMGYPVDKGHSCGQMGYSMDRRNVPTKKEAYPNPALPVRGFLPIWFSSPVPVPAIDFFLCHPEKHILPGSDDSDLKATHRFPAVA